MANKQQPKRTAKEVEDNPAIEAEAVEFTEGTESAEESKPKLNQDGLEAGATVDFYTLKKIEAEQRNAKTKKDESA